MKPTVQHVAVLEPRGNTCRFKSHRFRSSFYAEMPRTESGRKSRTERTTFLVQHCACNGCGAARLTR